MEEKEMSYEELKGFHDRLYNTHLKALDRNSLLRAKIRSLESENKALREAAND